MSHPDIHDLDSLLEQLRTRHKIFFHVALILYVFGVFGLLCLLGIVLR